jgi:hypothetical protein
VKEIIIEDKNGAGRAKLGVRDNEASLTFLDAQGHPTAEVPAKAKP